MSKLELWEYLYENKGWHSSTELRERFNIRQQLTLRKWASVPFIISYGTNLKRYKFNDDAIAEYKEAIDSEVYVPPIKLRSGKEVSANIPEPSSETYSIQYAFLSRDLGKAVNKHLEDIAKLGPEWNWVKEAVLSMEAAKYSASIPNPKNIARGLGLVLTAITEHNGYNFEGIQAIKEALSVGEPQEINIDDIRQAELNDIMKHVPKNADKEEEKEEEEDYSSWFDNSKSNSTT